MIERHVVFHVLPDKAVEFETFFESEYSVAMAKQPGFCGAELLRPVEASADRMMVLRFESLEAAQAWRESAEHKSLSPRLKALYQGSEVQVFDIVCQRPRA